MVNPCPLNIPKCHPVIPRRDNPYLGSFKSGIQNLRIFCPTYSFISKQLHHLIKQIYNNSVDLLIFLCLRQQAFCFKAFLLHCNLFLYMQCYKRLVKGRCQF